LQKKPRDEILTLIVAVSVAVSVAITISVAILSEEITKLTLTNFIQDKRVFRIAVDGTHFMEHVQ
jgi:hypothetical protein